MANLTRYNPYNDFVTLREAVDRLFEDSFISPRFSSFFGGRSATPANLYETGDGFTLQVPMPAVNPNDVEINVHQDIVNLKWQTRHQIPEGATVHFQGFQAGEYQQSFTLPAPVNADRAEAHYNDGILTLSLPKAEHAKARTVKVNAR